MSAVTIRPYVPSDAAELFAAATESVEDVYRWLAWCHPEYAKEDAEAWIQCSIEQRVLEREFHFAVLDGDGAYLGGCGLNRIDRAHGLANLGYWVRTSASGRGVATEATRRLAEWAFAHTDLVRLEIVAAVDNVASCRVAERAGAAFEGVLRSRLLLHGEPHDARLYALVRPRG